MKDDDEEEFYEEEEEPIHHHAPSPPPPPPPTPKIKLQNFYQPKPHLTFSTKRPTFKPTSSYYEEESEIEDHPITTKFAVKHPTTITTSTHYSSHDDEEEYHPEPVHVAPKFPSSSGHDFHSSNVPTSYTHVTENFDSKTKFEPSEHLSDFDTTKLLHDYHKNKPSITKLPTHPVSTKFSIEDATPFVYKQNLNTGLSHQNVHQTIHHNSHIKPTVYKTIHQSPHHVITHEHIEEHIHENAPSDLNLNNLKLGGSIPNNKHHFTTTTTEEHHDFHDFKPNFNGQDSYHGQEPLTQKQLAKLLAQNEKPKFKPHQEIPSYNEHQPLSQKQLAKIYAQQQAEKDEKEHFIHPSINSKNPASLGQYQQFLKSQEDEKIEHEFVREQLKFKQQTNNKRPYVRPPPNKFHPGRKPPKRVSVTPGLGAYRTTYKIPYGFHA